MLERLIKELVDAYESTEGVRQKAARIERAHKALQAAATSLETKVVELTNALGAASRARDDYQEQLAASERQIDAMAVEWVTVCEQIQLSSAHTPISIATYIGRARGSYNDTSILSHELRGLKTEVAKLKLDLSKLRTATESGIRQLDVGVRTAVDGKITVFGVNVAIEILRAPLRDEHDRRPHSNGHTQAHESPRRP